MTVTRRGFLAASAAASAAVAAPAAQVARKRKKYRTALVGTGWWGMNILTTAVQSGDVQVVGMCDVDRNQLDAAMTKLAGYCDDSPKRYEDFRDLIDEQKPEIVICATPDHWHPLVTIAALNAGAHVYVEKPISHCVLEGTAMVHAARANDRVVQVGTHRRVSPHNMSAMQFLREGKAGEVGLVRAFVLSGPWRGTAQPDGDPPEGLNWDFWCGPAPLAPYNPAIHPKGFRKFLDYANGTLGDWGIHWLDQILWWTEEKHPKTVSSVGARRIVQDNTDAPDTQIVQYDFESFTAIWEHHKYQNNKVDNHNIGCYFYGTEGIMHIGWRDGWTFYPRASSQEPIHVEPQLNKPDDQNIRELWADFVQAIETGKTPACDIEIGHRSTTMSLLGMLSQRIGRSVAWDGENQRIPDDPEANKLLRREYRDPWKFPEIT